MSFGIIAATTISAGVGYLGARKAAKSQEAAANTAAGAQERGAELIYQQFKDTEANLKPFITGEGGPQSFQMQQALAGARGPEAQQEAFDQYVESPGVAFLRERGMRGIEQNAAAQGNLFSGNTLKALSQFNQGLALQDFNNYYNRLGSLTGVSLGAASALGGVGGNAAAGQAGLISGAGAERAAGQVAQGRTYQSAFDSLGQSVGNIYEAWQNRPRSNTGTLGGWQGSIDPNIGNIG